MAVEETMQPSPFSPTMEDAATQERNGEQSLTPKSSSAGEVQRRLSFSSDDIAQENVASAPTVDTNPDCDLEMRQPKVAKGKEPANGKEPNSVPELGERKEAVSQEGSGRQKVRMKQANGKCAYGRRKTQFKAMMGIRRRNTSQSQESVKNKMVTAQRTAQTVSHVESGGHVQRVALRHQTLLPCCQHTQTR